MNTIRLARRHFLSLGCGSLHPGSAIMVTDPPAHPDTRTGTDFVNMRDGHTG